MSEDGYIVDQDYTRDLQYGKYASSFNGCGWIAAYNFVHAMGEPDRPEDVHRAMLSILPFFGTMGTPMQTMALFFKKRGIKVRRFYGGKNVLYCAADAPRGIIRYEEGREPHYTAFVKTGEDRFRFLNCADRQEDFEAGMEEFIRDHIDHFFVRIILPAKG